MTQKVADNWLRKQDATAGLTRNGFGQGTFGTGIAREFRTHLG
ncbi:hypothetical protein O9992_20730 [Vibrio lentus]|nr:hypothetical protein [Vibrio lentus]